MLWEERILEPDGAFYDRVWSELEHLDRVSPAAFHRRRLIRRLIAEHAADARSILDAGSGPGQLVEELSLHFPAATLSAADVSPHSLEQVRARCPASDAFLLDLTAGDFEREHAERFGRFDLVVCSEVIEHVADDALALRRLERFLAPGGCLIVTVPGGKMSRFDVAIGHRRHYRKDELEARLVSGGLEPVRVMAWGFPFQNFYRSAVRVASRAAIPGHAPREGSGKSGGLSRILGAGYAAFGALMLPLFFLNLPWLGEQLVAVARKSA
ncbi:MAG TPA: class I SAM-dependent methyltransferase [Polyangiaceae bacterium]